MVINGLQKLTLVDYPSHVASIVFIGGCNFRCPFCHNASLVLCPEKQDSISESEFFSFLKRRKKLIDGVVVTGGEPTLQKDLPLFLSKIKSLGYCVKLDTNGYMPDVLFSVIEKGVVDYVAMDIKNSLDMYPETAGIDSFDSSRIKRSADILISGIVDYEFRTTVVNELHSEESFRKIGVWLKNASSYYLQSFVPSENTMKKCFSAPDVNTMNNYVEILRNYIGNVQIRNL